MAILQSFPNVEAQICVNEIPLEEYLDDEVDRLAESIGEYQAARTVSRYIESQTDQEFSIRLTMKPPYPLDCPSLWATVKIDGVRVRGAIFIKNLDRDGAVVNLRGAEKGETSSTPGLLLPYIFTKIETSSDDNFLSTVREDSQRISQVGEILIQVFRASEGVETPRHFVQASLGKDKDKDLEVHEKALKGQAKSHGVGHGEGRPSQVSNYTWKASLLDSIDRPLVRFVFKYRSKQSLTQLHIIERTPSPPRSPVLGQNSVNLDNLNAEQKRKVESFVQNLVGGGSTSSSSASGTRVKRERDESRGSGPLKKMKQNSREIETIDLTDESRQKPKNIEMVDLTED